MKFAVSCAEVAKSYQQGKIEVPALKKITLQIRSGEFVSLSGPSGSGKTTLLNLIGGLDRPSAGEIHVAGMQTSRLSQSQLATMRLNYIGFIFPSYNLIPVLTARENVEFVMQLQGVEQEERTARAVAMLETVGLSGLRDRRSAELSGVQQQRVAVARAVVANPTVVLADEPTANLDSKSAGTLLELMRQINEEQKVAFIFSTHDPLVTRYARRIVTLHDGEIVDDRKQA